MQLKEMTKAKTEDDKTKEKEDGSSMNNQIINALKQDEEINSKDQAEKRVQRTQHGKKFANKVFYKNSKVLNKISYGDFNNFVDVFLQLPTDKKYKTLITPITPEKEEMYNNNYVYMYDYLRLKICSLYQFNQGCKIPELSFVEPCQIDLEQLNSLLD